jgi:hypothetical protein
MALQRREGGLPVTRKRPLPQGQRQEGEDTAQEQEEEDDIVEGIPIPNNKKKKLPAFGETILYDEKQEVVQPVPLPWREVGYMDYYGLAGVWTKKSPDGTRLIVIFGIDMVGASNFILISPTLLMVKTNRAIPNASHPNQGVRSQIERDFKVKFNDTDLGSYQVAYCIPLAERCKKIKERKDYQTVIVLALKIEREKPPEWF